VTEYSTSSSYGRRPSAADAHLGLESELEYLLRRKQTRRNFLATSASALGTLFLATTSSGGNSGSAGAAHPGGEDYLDFTRPGTQPLAALPPQFAARARRIIYLYMSGAPSQLELFDYKPVLARFDGQNCPDSVLAGKRFAFITGKPKLLGPQYPFHRAGQSGAWISDRFPYLEKHVDDLCFIKSMRTDQFNHTPAQMLMQTGNARLGYPSLGSWINYGLGTENQNMPGFIVLLSGSLPPDGGKQLWGAGFLPSVYQGVECRSRGEPVLYLNNPRGVTRAVRRRILNAIDEIDRATYTQYGNPETVARIAQYEMAFRMQIDATDVFDIRREPKSVLERYGAKPGGGTFANNCVVARRLAEKGVRFVQLFHSNWDSHGGYVGDSLGEAFTERCREVDQPIAALLTDLKDRGMLEDTLVIWAGEFGRTSMRENRSGRTPMFTGRDHNPSAFTIWLAGAGIKPGISHGETDDLGYEVVKDPVEIRDLHATLLYLLGFDHRRLSYSFQGLSQKLTGVKSARVVSEILA
jgi:Protein of unknown function (DUF1501)